MQKGQVKSEERTLSGIRIAAYDQTGRGCDGDTASLLLLVNRLAGPIPPNRTVALRDSSQAILQVARCLLPAYSPTGTLRQVLWLLVLKMSMSQPFPALTKSIEQYRYACQCKIWQQ